MITFEVHVHPGSKVNRVGGLYAGALVVRVREKAVDGRATDAVTSAIADAFGVGRSQVACLRGHRSRRKYLSVEGEEIYLTTTLNELLGI